MIFELFLLGVAFAIICLFIGMSQQSFPFAYLGMFIFLIIGLFLMQEGLDMATGSTTVGMTVSTVYTTHTVQNDQIVNVIASTFFYIPLAGVLLSTLMTLRGWRKY